MAKTNHYTLVIFSFCLLTLSLNFGESSTIVKLQTWCVAKPSTNSTILDDNEDFACNHVDCSPINEGGACHNPNTNNHHASYAMNGYYQRERHQWNCNFGDSGLLTFTNPSYGGCTYNGGETMVDISTLGKWCVAKPMTNNDILQSNIDYACNQVDCSIIRPGGTCYDPNTLLNHASIAMNLYYQSTGKADPSCDFKTTGLVVMNDPSYDSCKYAFQK